MKETSVIYQKKIQINTFECDVNRKWKPSAFFQYLSEAAGNHADLLGCGYEMMLSRNLFWVHSRMKIKFFDFPQAGDHITIRTWPKTIQQKLFYIRDFEILDAEGKRLATATSAWLIINASTRRLAPPQSLDFNLPSDPELSGLDEPLDRLSFLEGGEERLRVTAGYSAVDLLGHVNNSRYVEWICDTFPIEKYQNDSLDWIQINYDKEILPGEEIGILSSQSIITPTLWSFVGNRLSTGKRSFEAILQWKE